MQPNYLLDTSPASHLNASSVNLYSDSTLLLAKVDRSKENHSNVALRCIKHDTLFKQNSALGHTCRLNALIQIHSASRIVLSIATQPQCCSSIIPLKAHLGFLGQIVTANNNFQLFTHLTNGVDHC